MKLLKRFGAALLSLAIIMSFGAFTVGAVDPAPTKGSITFQNDAKTLTKSDFSAYKIVDWTYNGGGVYTNMKLNPTYKAAIVSNLGLTGTPSDNAVLTAVSKLTDKDKLAALAIALKGAATGAADYKSTDGTGKISDMALGYYLVVETQNGENDGTVISKPMLVRLPEVTQSGSTYTPNYEITINIKTSKANIEKKIVISDHPASVTDATTPANLFDTSTAALGDTVNYRSLATIPTYPLDATTLTYKISDEMVNGLTLNQSSIAVNLVGPDAKPLTTSDYSVTSSDHAFTVTLKDSESIKLWGNNGDKVLVTYSAVVNDQAVSGQVGNPNTTYLTYSVKSGDTTGYETPKDTVITYTFDLIVEKQDDAANPLEGAEFTLSKWDGTKYVPYAPIETKIDAITKKATVTFPKLNIGKYRLEETKAPAGFNTYAPVEFTVTAKNTNDGDLAANAKFIPDLGIIVADKFCGNDKATGFLADWNTDNKLVTKNYDGKGNLGVIIMDTKGFQLPLSGGMGTALFTVGGIGLVAVAGVLLLVYNKKRKAANH